MQIKPTTRDAYNLLHEGSLALAWIEQQGIRIDVGYCNRMKRKLSIQIRKLEEKLDTYSEIQVWRRIYADNFNLDSDPQIRRVLFKELKFKGTKETAKSTEENKTYSADQEALESIGLPFTNDILEWRKLSKARNTYIGNIIRETVGEYLHPFFHLHIVPTYRSSSSNINFQNLPKRQKDIMKLIRRAFIPRPGHMLGGWDYSGIEVRVGACYHKDPQMIKYIQDETTDMHRDMTEQCFLLKRDQIVKLTRDIVKGDFVFAEFYGSYWEQVTKHLWDKIPRFDLTRTDGMPLKEHLREQGIKSFTQFERHIRDVEDDFWNNRFSVYNQWRKDRVKRYEKDGYLDMFTGFRCSGVLAKNKIINYPIQGTAFHCLLWSLIQLVKYYRKEKLRSKIVGQIHDEGTMDNHPDEIEDIMTTTYEIACNQIREHWPWIIVPLSIEAEFTGIDEDWTKKKPYPITILEPF